MDECSVVSTKAPSLSSEGKPGKDGDSSGYLLLNPFPGKIATAILLFPYRVNVSYLIGNSIDEANMLYRMGSHAELIDDDFPAQKFSGSITLEKGSLLELRVGAFDNFAAANFKITKV